MYNLVSLIYRGLQSEYEAVQIYKEVANSARQLGQNAVAAQFDEISRDEMEHIGNLTELLKVFLPEDYTELQEKMQSGYTEVQEDLQKFEPTDNMTSSQISSSSLNTYREYLNSIGATWYRTNDKQAIIVETGSIRSELSHVLTKLYSIQKDTDTTVTYSTGVITIC